MLNALTVLHTIMPPSPPPSHFDLRRERVLKAFEKSNVDLLQYIKRLDAQLVLLDVEESDEDEEEAEKIRRIVKIAGNSPLKSPTSDETLEEALYVLLSIPHDVKETLINGQLPYRKELHLQLPPEELAGEDNPVIYSCYVLRQDGYEYTTEQMIEVAKIIGQYADHSYAVEVEGEDERNLPSWMAELEQPYRKPSRWYCMSVYLFPTCYCCICYSCYTCYSCICY